MKKTTLFTVLLALVLSLVCLSACTFNPGGNENATVTINGTEQTVALGSLLEEPTAPKKNATKEYEYVFDGWYIEGTETKWNFETDKVTKDVSLVPVFTETTRKYQVKIGSADPVLLEYGTKLTKPTNPTKDSDSYYDYEFAGWYKDSRYTVAWNFETDVVTGVTTIYAKFTANPKSFMVTIGDADPVAYSYRSKIEEPAKPAVPDNLKDTHRFNRWVNKATGETWDFANDYVQSDLVLVPEFTEMFTLNFLPEEITVAGSKYQTVTFTDADYAAMVVTIKDANNETVEHGDIKNKALKLDVTAGNYTYTVELNGKTFSGNFTVGTTNSFNAYLVPEVKIGGNMGTATDQYQYASFGKNYSIKGNSISMWSHTYAFVGDGTLVDKVYIEANVYFPANALGMMAGIMPACEYANLSGEQSEKQQGEQDINRAKLVFSVSASNKLYSQKFAGWGGSNVVGEVENVAEVNTNYKLGVLRYENNYYIFVDDVLKLIYTTSDFGKCGFGFALTNPYGGVSASNPIKNTDVKYITDETVLNKMLMTVIGTATINYDPTVISVKQGDVEITNNSVTANARTYIEFNAPEGQTLTDYTISSNSGSVPVYEENGKVYFIPEKGKVYNLTATFANEVNATVTVNLKPYALTVDGTEYALNNFTIVPSDVTLSYYNFSTSKTQSVDVDDLSPILNLKTGKYTFTAKYADNVTETSVSINEETQNVTVYLSNAYMGGHVTGDGYTAKSYSGASATATSGSSWYLTRNLRDTVTMTGYTFAYFSDLYASTYYAEATFDTEVPDYYLNTSDKFNGIMIASRHADLDGNGTSGGDEKMKVFAGIYGKSIVLTYTNAWNASNTITIANWAQVLGQAPSQVKLGIVRDGTDYYFFVNDTFVAKKALNIITNKCGVGVANLRGTNTIYKFNASTNAELIAALKAQATESKQIDLYIIAGQSNASGYTVFNNKTMLETDDSLVYGNNNILYAGRAQYTNGSSVGANEYNWGLARVGQGAANNKMSAEAAMSTVLSSYYNTQSGKVAGIVKFAHGGTALLNNTGGENAVGGNWVPKSYADRMGYNWSEGDPLTGRLYRNLIKQVTQRVNELKAEGYTEINIKGVWWMQGESDKGSPNEYKVALECLISDLRKDLGQITNEDLSNLAIIIGEISRTSGSADSGTVTTNKNFIAMQNAYCESHANVYISKIGDYDINKVINGVSTAVGTDSWHWNQKDMVKIGQDAGRIILEKVLNFSN